MMHCLICISDQISFICCKLALFQKIEMTMFKYILLMLTLIYFCNAFDSNFFIKFSYFCRCLEGTIPSDFPAFFYNGISDIKFGWSLVYLWRCLWIRYEYKCTFLWNQFYISIICSFFCETNFTKIIIALGST